LRTADREIPNLDDVRESHGHTCLPSALNYRTRAVNGDNRPRDVVLRRRVLTDRHRPQQKFRLLISRQVAIADEDIRERFRRALDVFGHDGA
jgi:hypothetical protein